MKAFKLATPAVICAIVLSLSVSGCSRKSTGPSGGAPTIESISPTTGTVGTEVTVTGTNFRTGADVLFNDLAADSVDVTSSTTIFAIVPAGVETGTVYTVEVRNSDGTRARLEAAFTPVAPSLKYVNSASRPSGNIGSTVIIEGEAFGDIQETSQVLFSDGAGGTIAASIADQDDWTDTFIVTTVPSGTETGDIIVETATGISNALTFTVTQSAAFSPSAISWTGTTDMPVALSGHQAVFVPTEDAGSITNYVHVTGGVDDSSTPRTEMYYATIQSDGQLSAWNSGTALPEARAFHASIAATPFNARVSGTGHIYVLGGISTAGGQPTVTVYRAPLNTDGSIGSWATTTPLPVPLHSLGAVIFRSAVYIAGGSTTDDAPVAEVYRARIDSLGELSAWEAMPSLPFVRSYHGFTAFGGFLHTFGGDSTAVSPNDGTYSGGNTRISQIAYVKIDLRTGDLAELSWTVNSTALTKAVSKHSAVIAGGNALITAGLYNGAGNGSSENSFAQLNSDGSVGSFGGATGSVTIYSQGGGNLFNHASLGYVDAEGVAHVMVLGGDDVNNPGVKRTGVWFY